jgi:glycosyltransferase involved in cell wall biosynthesis
VKVNHFNTYPHGGAANAAMRIHQGLVDSQVDSTFFYRLNEKETPTDPRVLPVQFTEPGFRPTILKPLIRKLEKRRRRKIHQLYDTHLANRDGSEHEVFSMARLPVPTRLDWTQHNCDIIQLHWLAFLADHVSFFGSIPDETPIVWTLHDMSAFTGGCHYSENCDRFQQGCGNCPQVVHSGPRDVSADSIRAKRKSLQAKSLHVVAPSKWLIDLARQSPVWPKQTNFSVIHYGLDLSTFHPHDKASARKQLGMSPGKVIIGFGADDLNNRRKGFAHLLAALERIGRDTPGRNIEIELAFFGEGTLPEGLKAKFATYSLGFVAEPETLAQVYSACDFVVVPSLEDNQPQVGLEAMACGRAVIGFNAGGIPEYVTDQTGILIPRGDDQELAAAISQLSKSPSRFEAMGNQARILIEQAFEIRTQSEKYAQLYQRILSNGSKQHAA